MRRNNKGVSLIVLSITILVMAILAATAIIALEDSGIIGRSKNTTAKQNYNEEYTRLQVIKNGILTDNLGEITVDEYITELTNKGLIESGTTTNSDGSKTVTTKTGFVLNVKQDGDSNLILSLGESNSAISISPVTLTGDITDGPITKTITATTKNVSGDISWTTSNSSVATVSGTNSGATVTLKGVGTATITATYGAAKASCAVTVTGTTPTISLSHTNLSRTIESGSTSTVSITATTANISGALTWSSSNTSVATVSASGNTATITLKSGGTAVITASYGTTSASCNVTVTEVTPSITLSPSTIAEEITAGTTETVSIAATTSNVSGTIVWSSSNTSVATVSGTNSGATVTLKAVGTTTITASYGSVKATCTITVTEAAAAELDVSISASVVCNADMSITIDLSNVTNFPVTVEYYYKLASADDTEYGSAASTATVSSGTSYTFDYSLPSVYTSYTLKAIVTDSAGNVGTATTTAGTGCFVAGTKILTENGLKNIEDIEVGEKVYAINTENNARELKIVTRKFEGYSDETFEITIGDKTIITTPKHEFYVVDKGWVRAYDLEEGDQLSSTLEENLVITKIVQKFHEEPVPVYNMTVDGFHTYLITEHEFLVHNLTSPC